MKKIIAVLIVTAMLAVAACATVSAEIRFYDPFDTWTSYWFGYDSDDRAGDLNVITTFNGDNVLEGWEEARVHQGLYADNEVLGKGYANSGSALITGTFWVELRAEDTGNECGAGLWWKNTYHETHEDAEGSDTYLLFYYPVTSTVKFMRDFPGATTDEEKLVKEWSDPKARGNNLNDPITLGMRVEAGKISAFVDGQCIASFEDASLGNDPCPILLWNDGLHAIWDNFYVGDLAELPLDDTAPAASDAPAATEKVVETETRLVTDTDGNTVVEVVTNEVARPAANTGAAPSGGTAARTGDMLVVVVAVMIAALGSAIIVKKVTAK